MPPTTTLPTYADTIPGILQWAADRGLLHPDGTAYRATPWGQHQKTLEEIGEASLELRKMAKTKALAERLFAMGTPDLIYDAVDILARRKHRLALEFGDVLVTLTLQAAMQWATLEQCLFDSGRLGTGYGSDWRLGKVSDPHCIWEYVDYHASLLGMAIDIGHGADAAAYLGAVARCVEDQARIELALTGPECLAMALAKIAGRDGEVVEGQFVRVKASR